MCSKQILLRKQTSIIDDSVITSDEIISVKKHFPTNLNGKEVNCEMETIYILLAFLLITIALLTVASIYGYLMKHQPKQKRSLPYHDTSNKLK